jgi:predicted DsbA family dithiol-disulfide isomerase
MAAVLPIEIYSDVVCPWCFLGKRRLEAALRARPDLPVALRWRPFELNPGLGAAGADRREYLASKFPDAAGLAEAHRRLVALGREAGIDYRFEAIARVPNTRAAHALVALAGDREGAVVEALFRAYFEDGRDVGDLDVLAAIAADAGLDPADVRGRLAAGSGRTAIEAQEREAARLGVSGVPLFVFAGRWAVSGAQEPATLVSALDQVAAELARRGPAVGGPAPP